MDTDDLTPMAHEIIDLAYGEEDALRSEIGASAINYKSEEEFLKGTLNYVEEIIEDPEEYLDSWNLLDLIDVSEFEQRLQKVKKQILETQSTPIRDRGKPPFQDNFAGCVP